MEGFVKMYNADRGFGFIQSEGRDYFFHVREVVDPSIAKGDHVSFESVSSEKGPKAVGIQIVQAPPAPEPVPEPPPVVRSRW